MVQITKIAKDINQENTDSFQLVPALITMFLMILFVGSAIYVLISSLL